MNRIWLKYFTVILWSFLFALNPSSTEAGKFKEQFQDRLTQGNKMQFQQSPAYDQRFGFESEEAPQDRREPLHDGGSMGAGGSSGQAPVLGSYAIYQTDYEAQIKENVVTVNGTVVFQVFHEGWIKLPLVKSSVGLIDVSVNRSTAFVIMENNMYHLMIDRPGKYTMRIEFLIKAQREREMGPGSFSFETIPAPISQYEFTMPESGVEIFVDPAIKVEVEKYDDKTIAWAVMPNTRRITTRWSKELLKEEIERAEVEPKIYADTMTYATVGEGIIQCKTTVQYSILQAEVSNMRLAIPDDISILDVVGQDLRDWMVIKDKDKRYLDIYLNFGKRGKYQFDLTYERNIGEGSVVAEVPVIKVVGAERETGYFGIAAKTNVELTVNKSEKVAAIDVHELPANIWRASVNPILLAFKYISHPFYIAIDVIKHEELPVLVAAIDSADYVSLRTEEGKILTKATYQVRNNFEQYLRLKLPPKSELWTTFVSGEPIKPAKDQTGSVLVPLQKSRLRGESLTQFPVEIVYLDQKKEMNFFGAIQMDLPQVDLPVNQMTWSIYVPTDYTFFNFGGNVKQGGAVRSKTVGRLLTRSIEEPRPLDVATSSQVANIGDLFQERKGKGGWDADQRRVGVLPIKIDIPKFGQKLTFSKILVIKGETPTVKMHYTIVLHQVGKIMKFIIIFLIVFILGRWIKRKVRPA